MLPVEKFSKDKPKIGQWVMEIMELHHEAPPPPPSIHSFGLMLNFFTKRLKVKGSVYNTIFNKW